MKAAVIGHQGNRPGRVGHDAVAAGDLHAGGVHGRAVGRFFSSFGAHGGLRHLHELVRLVHDDAHALLAVPQAQEEARQQQGRPGLAGDRRLLRLDPRLVAAAPLGDRGHDGRPVGASRSFLFRIVGFDFIPRDDQSEFEVAITLPEGYTLDRADKLFAEIEGRLAKLRGVTNVFSTIGDTTGRVAAGQGDVTTGTIYVRLIDLEERQRTWYDWQFWYNAHLQPAGGRPAATSPSSTCSATPARS